jgi:hypothetical protein
MKGNDWHEALVNEIYIKEHQEPSNHVKAVEYLKCC